MRRIALALMFAATASAAQAQRTSRAPTVTAVMNQQVSLRGVSIRPVEVVEDSRCPQEMDCYWAGQLLLRTIVDGQSVVLTLREAQEYRPGQWINLVSVTPDRWRSLPPNVDRVQRFTFRIGR